MLVGLGLRLWQLDSLPAGIHFDEAIDLRQGLRILEGVREKLKVPVLTDVHEDTPLAEVASVVDVLQTPAFLCRQTNFILAVARQGCPVNIKKGQFLAPWDVRHIVEKITSTGNRKILITDRGTAFGYNNLVADFRAIRIMQETGFPVIFDATHSIQLPGGAGKSSGGQRDFAPMLARAAVAAGVNGIFIEVHENPDQALCDGPNSLKLDGLEHLLTQLLEIRKAISL